VQRGGRRAVAGDGRLAGGRRPEVEEGSDRWVPPVSGRRDRGTDRAGEDWAERETGLSAGKDGRERRKESWAGPREKKRQIRWAG
jgi:hypothetical protein